MDGGTDVGEWKTLETVDDRLGDAELEQEDLRPRVCTSLKLKTHTRHRHSLG